MEGAARVEAHRAGRGLALLLAFWFLSCSACDTDAYNSPEPSSLEHHQHTVILRFRTINHEADTVGVASASADFGAILTRRDAEVDSRARRLRSGIMVSRFSSSFRTRRPTRAQWKQLTL